MTRRLFSIIAAAVACLMPAAPAAADIVFEKQWGDRGIAEGKFKRPQGITVFSAQTANPGRVVVADSDNARLQFFDAAGGFQRLLGYGVKDGSLTLQVCTGNCGPGIPGTAFGQMRSPTDVAVSNADPEPGKTAPLIAVADPGGAKVMWYTDTDPSTDGGLVFVGPHSTGVDQPRGLGYAIDPAANVAANGLLVAMASAGTVQKLSGGPANPPTWDGTDFSTPQLSRPADVSTYIDPEPLADGSFAASVAVADTDAGRIVAYDGDGAFKDAWSVTPGRTNERTVFPTSVTHDIHGQIYVADPVNNRILKFSAAGKFLRTFGVGVDGDEDEFESCPSPRTPKGGSCHVGAQSDEPGGFRTPHGVAVASDGRIFVADTNNHRIQSFHQTAEMEGPAGGQFALAGPEDTEITGRVPVKNVGDFPFTTDGAPTIAGSGVFSLGPTSEPDDCQAGAVVLPGAACHVPIVVDSDNPGSHTATLNVASDASNSPLAVTLSASISGPQIELEPNPVSFQLTGPGEPVSAEVEIKNTGANDTEGSGGNLVLMPAHFAIGGGPASPFSIDSTDPACHAPAGLPPGTSCTVEVEFDPADVGSFSDTLEIASNAPHSPAIAELFGVAATSSLGADPTTLLFGPVEINQGSEAQTLDLVNEEDVDLTIDSISVTGGDRDEFEILSTDCPANRLPRAHHCFVDVRFTPTGSATTIRSAELLIESRDLDDSLTVPLGGPVTHAIGSTNRRAIRFPPRKGGTVSGPKRVAIENVGTAPLRISAIRIVGPDASQFIAGSECNGATVQPGGRCKLSTRFLPSVNGEKSASLVIDTNSTPTLTGVALSGVADSRDPRLKIRGPRRTSHRRPTFHFAADEPTRYFLCRVGPHDLHRCQKRFRTKRLKGGARYLLRAVAVDLAGNRSRVVTKRFKILR